MNILLAAPRTVRISEYLEIIALNCSRAEVVAAVEKEEESFAIFPHKSEGKREISYSQPVHGRRRLICSPWLVATL